MITVPVIFVFLPSDRPLFGLRDELHLRVGLSVRIISPEVGILIIFKTGTISRDDRIEKGLKEFNLRYPGTKYLHDFVPVDLLSSMT